MQKLIELKNKKGFTLIEMLIVIMIVVVLIAIAVPAVAAYRRDALRTQDEGGVETILTALEAAYVRKQPTNNSGHWSDVGAGTDFFESGTLDYGTLAAGHADPATDEYYKLVAEYLGPNFHGNFKFIYNDDFRVDGSTISQGGVALIAYWRSENVIDEESVMIYYPEVSTVPLYYSEISGDFTHSQLNGIITPLPFTP